MDLTTATNIAEIIASLAVVVSLVFVVREFRRNSRSANIARMAWAIDTALVRIPDASHGIASRPSQFIAKVDNILPWFERYSALQSVSR